MKRKGGRSDKAEEPGRRGLDGYGRRRGSDAKRHSNQKNSKSVTSVTKCDSRSDHTPSSSSVPPAGDGASRQGETYRPQRGQSGRAHEDEDAHRAERKHAGVSTAEHRVCAQENPEYNKHSPFTPEPPKHGSRRVPADRVDQTKQHSKSTGRAAADRADTTKQHSQGTRRAAADRADQTRKFSSRQTTSHSSKNAAQRKTTLYIRIHDVIDDIVALGEVLTSRLNKEGVELTPTEAGITRDDRFTYCSLTCDSKSKASKLKTLLMKDKRSTPALDCSFVDFQQEAGDFDHSQPALQKKKAMSQESLKGPVELEMNSMPEDAVYKHSQSVDEVVRGTNRAKRKLGDADTITDCQQEPGDLDQRQSSLLKKQAIAKESLKKKVEFEISSMSDDVLLKHKQKVDEVERKIDKAKQKLGDVNTRRETRAEIEALENKLEELDKQKTEFVSAVAGFRKELVPLFEHDDYQRDVGLLRKRVGVECARLDKALPMYARRQDVVRLVQQHPVSILLAETGSGKSTQVVQYLLEAGMADEGTIVCTQPRKVAAVSLATHVAQELATNVGKEVGYKVGSRRKTSPSTKIVYMTDHALLNECLTDPDLKAFSCVVVDEAHERSLYTDLLLSMVKRCLARRPDLRVIITSATIDPQVFVTYFGCCPILKVSGRAFPVDVIWQDSASEENEFEKYEEAAVDKVVEIHRKEPPGDVLVFLTSASEIQKCCEALQRRLKDRADFACLPLHGQLQAEEQQKVFQPLERGKRKIVFATNCAETSITIDGIRYVVDTGVAKEMRYNAKKSVNTLSVTAISRSSAEQRKGRAGRTAAGTCYRLYSQRSYRAMDAISLPEILKIHLGHALLKLAELGVTPDMYDFVQSPGQDAIEAALRTLRQLGALRDDVITETGRWIARLPFDPKLGLMTLRGRDDGLLYDVIVLASLASAGSGLFYRGSSDQDQKKLDKTKVKFSHKGGDILTALEVYKAWEAVDERQRNKWCMANSVNAKAVRGVKDSVKDVVQLLRKEVNVEVIQRFSDAQETPDKLRKLIFQCNADNLCHYLGRERAGYFAAQAGRQVHLHPSSTMRSLGSYPQWVVYDQLLQTSRDFITGITPVDDAWLEELGREQFGFDLEQVREKKLVNVFTQRAGSHAFFAMVGPRYSKLRQYEERLAALDSSVVVIIEAIREVGELRVFSTGSADNLATLTQEIRNVVDRSTKEVEQEVRELTVGSENSGLRVVVGQGGELTDILMPHETRKVFITRPSDDATEESIREKFREFGEICYVHQFPGGRNWGFVVFRTPAQAVLAAEITQEDEDNVGQLEHRRPAKHHADFKAKLFWCRRPCNGIGFVELSPAYMPRCLQLGFFDVGNSTVSIKVSNKRPEDGLYLRGLPAEATEDLIKRSLLYELFRRENVEGIINNVTVVREKIGKTSKHDLKRLENELKQKFERRLRTSKVEVSVDAPRGEESTRFAGEARFSDPIEGVAACRALRNRLYLNGVLVEVEPVISATLRVQRRVYNACKKELDMVIKRKLKVMEVEVTVKEQGADSYVLSLRANDPSDIVQARVFLNDVINGDVLDCNHAPALRHLMTSAGRKMLREAEKEVSAYISVDDRKWTVSIHGSSEACTKGECMECGLSFGLLLLIAFI